MDPGQQLDLFEETPARRVKPAAVSDPHHPLWSAGCPPGLYLGTSSWSFPGWEGLVYERRYTSTELAESGLEAYAQCSLFRCVSLDKSYYRPLPEKEYARLAAQVPADFRFVVKAPRQLLEPNPGGERLGERLEEDFLAPLQSGLGSKLGAVLLQFPPHSWQLWGSRERFLLALAARLETLPPADYALELRDAELLGPTLARTLQTTGVGLCASVHPRLPSVEQQLLAVPPPQGSVLVVRWNLRPSLSYQQALQAYAPFGTLQSPDLERRALLVRLVARALRADRKVFLTVNNKAEGCAPLSVRAFLEELQERQGFFKGAGLG